MALAALGLALFFFDGGMAPEPAELGATGDRLAIPAIPATPSAAAKSQTVPPSSGPPEPEPLWRAVDENSVDRLPPYREAVEGRALVRTADLSSAAGSWRVGDRVVLPIPQLGRTFHPEIDAMDDGPGGARSIIGTVVDRGRRHRFVVTVGGKHTLAFIDTANGSYELVAREDLGWLMPSANMDRDFDYSQPDYFLPGNHRSTRMGDAIR